MSYYYSVRGWLSLGRDEFRVAVNHVQALYETPDFPTVHGWCWEKGCMNGLTCYLFYGGDLRAKQVDVFEIMLRSIIGKCVEADGYFHVLGEDNDNCLAYTIKNGNLAIEQTGPILKYDASDA